MKVNKSYFRLIGAATLFAITTALCGCQAIGALCNCDIPGICSKKDKAPPVDKTKGPLHAKLKGPTVPVIPPVVPPAATPPPQSALGVAPGAPPPGPPTIWDKLGVGSQQREFALRQATQTPAGRLLGAMVAPLSALTGGVIPPLAPVIPSLQQLLAPGPIGAAAKFKMDQLNAEARKEAVKELANVDCHYWPEAEDALVAALRTDRNEAVRYAAAEVLKEGKCCTNKTIEALSISATGSERDGAPCETSAVIRKVAAAALEKCLKCFGRDPCGRPECEPGIILPPQEEKPREEPREPDRGVQPATLKPAPTSEPESYEAAQKIQLASYYEKVRKKPRDIVIAAGRESLAAAKRSLPDDNPASEIDVPVPAPLPPTVNSPRPVGLFDGKLRPSAPEQPGMAVKPAAGTLPPLPTRPKNLFDKLVPPTPADPSESQAKPMSQPVAPLPLPMPPARNPN